MSEQISASPLDLLNQASSTAIHYLLDLEKALDIHFGENFCKKNPEFLLAMIKVAAGDFQTSIALKIFEREMTTLSDAIAGLGEAITNSEFVG